MTDKEEFDVSKISNEEIDRVIEIDDDELKLITGGVATGHGAGATDPAYCRIN